MTISLTTAQLEAINKLVIPSIDNGFKPNYAGMYLYIYNEFKARVGRNN